MSTGSSQRGRREVVVITGASAGIGRAAAREFARQGARVALLARGRDGLEAARREVEDLGGEGLVLPTDVANAAEVDAAAEATERAFGPIDVWVNNAMVSVFSPIHQMEPQEYDRVTAVTYLGSVYGTLSALKRMRPRNRGKIVFVGSALAYRGIPLQSAYCGAKHAIQGFFDSLVTELMHDGSGIGATMVQLAAFNTPQFGWVKTRLPGTPRPVGTPYQPEVAARAIYWAAHHDRREMHVGYPASKAIIGNKIAPWYADHVLAKTGYEGQQQPRPVDADRPHNLWDPVPGDHGAHGMFDDEAIAWSPQVWASMHRSQLLLAAGAGLLGVAAAALLTRRREPREPMPPSLHRPRPRMPASHTATRSPR